MLRSSVAPLLAIPAPLGLAQDLTVCSYNVESGDADPNVVGQRLAAAQDVDLWGLSELQDDTWAQIFEVAAEQGENADFQHVTGTTGSADRLVIVYNATLLEEVHPAKELSDINIGGNVRAPLYGHFRVRTSGQEF